MPLYGGSCHCGAVRFTVDADITDVYVCDCSLCRKKNARMTSVRETKFAITAGADKLGLYRWNTGVARHYFCTVCGIYTFHKKRSMPDHYGVNVYCLDDFDPAEQPIRAADGKGMSLVDPAARPDWPGPRQS